MSGRKSAAVISNSGIGDTGSAVIVRTGVGKCDQGPAHVPAMCDDVDGCDTFGMEDLGAAVRVFPCAYRTCFQSRSL